MDFLALDVSGLSLSEQGTPVKIDWVDCTCKKCTKVKDHMSKGIWLHQGLGKLEGEMFDAPIGTKIKGSDLFNSNPTGEQNNVHYKPANCVWFSAGTWLFQPPGSLEDHCEEPSKKYKVVVLDLAQLPKEKVLRVTSKEILDEFIKKYSRNILFLKCIDWKKVEEDYLAVIFEFKKIVVANGVMFSAMHNNYDWHFGFDVETCVLFEASYPLIEFTIDLVEF